MKLSRKTVCSAALCTTVVLLTACSSKQYAPDPDDPLQGMNRVTFSFNQKLDKYALKPVAQGYNFIVPQPVQNRVTNFFSNLGEVPTFFNDTLQGNLKLSATALGRFVVNSTIGLLGLFDPASSMGLTKHYNDFGITLAQYGVTTSPYLVLPLIGPSSIRDALALWPNYAYMSVWGYMEHPEIRDALFILDIINLRASLLSSEDIARQASLDEYGFIRDAYLQKRASLIKRYTGRTVSSPGKPTGASDDPLDEYSEDYGQVVPLTPATSGNAPTTTTSNSTVASPTNTADTDNKTTTPASTHSDDADAATTPPPVSFRQQSNDPVKKSIAQNQLAEMDS